MMQTLERPALNMNRLFAATPFGRTRKTVLDASSERPDALMTGIADPRRAVVLPDGIPPPAVCRLRWGRCRAHCASSRVFTRLRWYMRGRRPLRSSSPRRVTARSLHNRRFRFRHRSFQGQFAHCHPDHMKTLKAYTFCSAGTIFLQNVVASNP